TRPRRADAVGADGLAQMADEAIAQILDFGVEVGGELVARVGRDDDFAGTGEGEKARGEIDAAAADVVGFDDDVADFEPHAEMHLALGRDALVAAVARLL